MRWMPLLIVLLLTSQAAAQYRTRNFLVTGTYAKQVAEAAESYRHNLAVTFLGQALPNWNTPASINTQSVNAHSYTTITFPQGGGVPLAFSGSWNGRPDKLLSDVVPHEVMHTVMASYFQRPLPRWVDEGLCVCVESERSQREHHTRNTHALQSDRGIPFNQLISMRQYPRDVGALYSQGHSLCRFLMMQHGPRKMMQYVGLGVTNSWTAANQHLGYRDNSHLQTQWVAWLAGQHHIVARCVYTNGQWQCLPDNAPTPLPPRGTARLADTPPAIPVRPDGPSGGQGPYTPQPPPNPPPTTSAVCQTLDYDKLAAKLAPLVRVPKVDVTAVAAALAVAHADELRGSPGRDGRDGTPGKDGAPGAPGKDGCDAKLDAPTVQRMVDAAIDAKGPIRFVFQGDGGFVAKAGLGGEVIVPPTVLEIQREDGQYSELINALGTSNAITLPPNRK